MMRLKAPRRYVPRHKREEQHDMYYDDKAREAAAEYYAKMMQACSSAS